MKVETLNGENKILDSTQRLSLWNLKGITTENAYQKTPPLCPDYDDILTHKDQPPCVFFNVEICLISGQFKLVNPSIEIK